MTTHIIQVGDQQAWCHHAHAAGGAFHTFDGLQCAGPNDRPRKVHVWLPPGYGKQGRHPLVLLNDGEAAFFPAALSGESWRVQVSTAALARDFDLVAPIIVGVVPLDRTFEYQHLASKIGPLNGGGLPGYARYLAEPLVDFIDHHYLTQRDRTARVVAGSSHGGLAAFYTAALRPDVFGAAIAMSPSFWSNHVGPIRHSALLAQTSKGLRAGGPRPRLWIDWGLVRSGGPHNWLIERWATWRGRDMVKTLQQDFGYQEGIDLFWREDPDGAHTESSWARRWPEALASVLPLD